MGVEYDEYVMIGVLADDICDEDFLDRHDADLLPYRKGGPKAGDIGILYDGMSGDYTVVGKVLGFGSVYEGGDAGVHCYTADEIASMAAAVRPILLEKYGIDREPCLMFLPHYH